MKKIMIVAGAALLAACSSHHEDTKQVGMANPASLYCVKSGGKLSISKGSEGEVGYCTLPDGEHVEEWSLYKRDHKG